MLTFMFSAFQSQGASVTKEPALHTIEREGASVTLFNFWKFSNVIFSNFPIQRIPVLVKNSGGIYRRCYFCLIRTLKVTKKKAQWTFLSPVMTERSHCVTKSHCYILYMRIHLRERCKKKHKKLTNFSLYVCMSAENSKMLVFYVFSPNSSLKDNFPIMRKNIKY